MFAIPLLYGIISDPSKFLSLVIRGFFTRFIIPPVTCCCTKFIVVYTHLSLPIGLCSRRFPLPGSLGMSVAVGPGASTPCSTVLSTFAVCSWPRPPPGPLIVLSAASMMLVSGLPRRIPVPGSFTKVTASSRSVPKRTNLIKGPKFASLRTTLILIINPMYVSIFILTAAPQFLSRSILFTPPGK